MDKTINNIFQYSVFIHSQPRIFCTNFSFPREKRLVQVFLFPRPRLNDDKHQLHGCRNFLYFKVEKHPSSSMSLGVKLDELVVHDKTELEQLHKVMSGCRVPSPLIRFEKMRHYAINVCEFRPRNQRVPIHEQLHVLFGAFAKRYFCFVVKGTSGYTAKLLSLWSDKFVDRFLSKMVDFVLASGFTQRTQPNICHLRHARPAKEVDAHSIVNSLEYGICANAAHDSVFEPLQKLSLSFAFVVVCC